jgi:hypothetical protein
VAPDEWIGAPIAVHAIFLCHRSRLHLSQDAVWGVAVVPVLTYFAFNRGMGFAQPMDVRAGGELLARLSLAQFIRRLGVDLRRCGHH